MDKDTIVKVKILDVRGGVLKRPKIDVEITTLNGVYFQTLYEGDTINILANIERIEDGLAVE